MSQNIYDEPGFFEGYAQLPRSLHGLAGAPEWPALHAMLPDLAGKRVLDLGCGYGWFCRAARDLGAADVVGIDLSAKMLARAAELTRDEAIRYRQGDLDGLALSDEPFDLIYSSLALHYLPEVAPLFAEIHRALVAGGSLVFSVEHPIFTCPQPQGWLVDAEGRRSWPVNGYQAEGKRVSNWLAEGVVQVSPHPGHLPQCPCRRRVPDPPGGGVGADGGADCGQPGPGGGGGAPHAVAGVGVQTPGLTQ
ncbi:class I SAM-dependent methyltransferase [Aeromonas caviae]|uniref:class I SAM-dependent methyltransferase n=1 Tax=Aeromonas caviae TaxID=648 RepID=UPI002AB42743|nr:class I SAM-dependent methyltransferase [Aeromonas caviae]MDY7784524.1 class I SAM-dependent methyltransferase [Aeromonas caviae]